MATPLVNSLPSSLLSWKTPYEVLYGHPPNYTSLRCLSCLCFATNIKAHKDKFSPRASKCVFLGFQPSMKAYKVYDLLSHIVFHSMDVVLLKLFFPSLPPSLCCLLPPLIFSLFLFLMSCSHPLPHALFLFLLQDALFFFLLPLLLQLLLIFSPLHPLFLLPLSLLFLLAPTWLRDFVTNHSFVPLPMPSYCSIVPPSSPYTPPIFPYVFSSHFSSSYLGFLGQVSSFHEPTSYAQACLYPEWRHAMHQELQALDTNHTCDLIPLSPNKKPIGCRWVFKTKLSLYGIVDRYKARLVAKGNHQIEGVDYFDSFSPMAKSVTAHLFIAVAIAHS